MRASGRLRNIHIQIAWIEKFFPRVGPGLNEFLKILARRKKSARKRFLKSAQAFNFKSGQKLFKNIKLQVAEPESEQYFMDQGRSLLKQQYQSLQELEPAIQDPKNIDSLHQFRLAFKSYRYTMEIVGPLVSSMVTAELIDSMHEFQTLLGELHDLDILGDDLARFSKGKKRTKYEVSDLKRAKRKLAQIRRKKFINFLPAQQMAMNAFHPDKLHVNVNENNAQPLAGEIADGEIHNA